MNVLLSSAFSYLDTFLLLFARVFGMFVIAPVFRNKNVPYIVKILLILMVTNILFSRVGIVQDVTSSQTLAYIFYIGMELVTGLVIGFSVYLAYAVFTMVGQFIDMQIGFSMVNIFDPVNSMQVTITGNLYYYMMILVVLVTNAHHFFIKALVESFEVVPVGGMAITQLLTDNVVLYMTRFFMLTLQFSAPIVFVILITNVVLGVLARAVPSLNMFVIGFPLKILFGLATIMVMLSAFSMMSDTLISDGEKLIRDSILYMKR